MRTIILFGLLCLSSFSFANYSSKQDFLNSKAELKALVFLSHKCPCSRSHVFHLNHIAKDYKDLALYGVMSENYEGSEKLERDQYFNKQGFTFPIIDDPKQELVNEYKALKTPHVTLMRKQTDGTYQIIYQGGLTDQKDFARSKKRYLAENLKALSKNQPLIYENGFSLGCYIKRN